MPSHPATPRLLRIAFILVGIAIFIWLSFENRSMLLVLIFSSLSSVLIAILLIHRVGIDRLSLYLWVMAGGVCGLAAPLLAVLLMLLKNGLHSHLAPDFSLAQVISVLQRAPFFVLGGMLVGLGMGLLRDYRRGAS